MIKFKYVTMRNFLSIGNITQVVKLDRQSLTLVLGENLDLGGDDSGNRNGVGKTALGNAISYALYGAAISNIKKDNLINNINEKNMLVTFEYTKNGHKYRIERGRKPNVLRYFVDDAEVKDENNEAQGDSRETQDQIERDLGFSHEMFKHIIMLNTYTPPFLSLPVGDQRVIIEQLLGVTQLSEKANRLKEINRITKEKISEEQIRIEAVKTSNKKIQDTIQSLRQKQNEWSKNLGQEIESLGQQISRYEDVDIAAEIETHKNLVLFKEYERQKKEYERNIVRLKADENRLSPEMDKLEADYNQAKEQRCHACGQALHDDLSQTMLEKIEEDICKVGAALAHSVAELARQETELMNLKVIVNPGSTIYKTIDEAYNHKTSLEKMVEKLTRLAEEPDRYEDQIVELESKGIQEVSFDQINQLNTRKEHQDFLIKLLTSKDSFVRKKIIDQNLAYLNARLSHYTEQNGLPHTVKFQNDLSVDITHLGKDLDFDNLSRGERNRLILALSWAFRDVYESLYLPINLMLIDEIIDNGTDASGVELSMSMLKQMTRERNKSVFLISHRDELVGRVNSILKVVKENSYTRYEGGEDTDDIEGLAKETPKQEQSR